jgi:hypothetical protein
MRWPASKLGIIFGVWPMLGTRVSPNKTGNLSTKPGGFPIQKLGTDRPEIADKRFTAVPATPPLARTTATIGLAQSKCLCLS